LLGGLIGAGLYEALIGRFLPGETKPDAVDAPVEQVPEHQPV
jgi:hypothetical protein